MAVTKKDRHRPGYYKDYNKKTGDRHRKGYYKDYNLKHPERLERIGIHIEENSEDYDEGDDLYWMGKDY